MRQNTLLVLLALATVAAFSADAVRAQEDSPNEPVKSEMEKAQEAATRVMEAWVKASIDFSKDIRLTEADVKRWIEVAPSFDQIGSGEDEEEDAFEKCYKDGKFSFDFILKDRAYGEWAREHGLEPTEWLRKHVRITMFALREQGLEHVETARKQLPRQLEQIEAMKGQVDEETYQQMKSSVQASVMALEKTEKLYGSIPRPTEAETKLLEKYERQLRRAMEDGEDEDSDEYDDEEDPDEGETGEEDEGEAGIEVE